MTTEEMRDNVQEVAAAAYLEATDDMYTEVHRRYWMRVATLLSQALDELTELAK